MRAVLLVLSAPATGNGASPASVRHSPRVLLDATRRAGLQKARGDSAQELRCVLISP